MGKSIWNTIRITSQTISILHILTIPVYTISIANVFHNNLITELKPQVHRASSLNGMLIMDIMGRVEHGERMRAGQGPQGLFATLYGLVIKGGWKIMENPL